MNTQRQTVADVPESFVLVSNSQDIQATLEHIGQSNRTADAGCLFVEVLDGEYGEVYLCERSIPYLGATIEKLQ